MVFDQAFSTITLSRTLRRSDFKEHPRLVDPKVKLEYLRLAVRSAQSGFGGLYPLEHFHLNGKTAYRAVRFQDELVLRLLCANIKRAAEVRAPSRDFLIANLIHLLREGVPYRVYRLDVSNFYESFHIPSVVASVEANSIISPVSKRLLRTLLTKYLDAGGRGLPRGLAIGAVLSEFMMMEFDRRLSATQGVYFFGRYVDDIVVLTNGEEDKGAFIHLIEEHLPCGLSLHGTKRNVLAAKRTVNPGGMPKMLFTFEYLGYRFTVEEPPKLADLKKNMHARSVTVDIAASKLKRLKTRIVRSFLDFRRTRDFDMLQLRVKYLTSNFSIKDFNRNRNKLAGIYFSYPQVSGESSESLEALDVFLRGAVLSGIGRVFSSTAGLLSKSQKRILLGSSFVRGHRDRIFVHYHPNKIKQIQKCWIHE